MINIIGNTISNAGIKLPVIYYFPILGQSQAGGYLASPALTTVSASNVQTLTNGPIDISTIGSLIAAVEGDDFTDTNGGGASPGVETIATSLAQQVKTFKNTPTSLDKYVVSVHARGGETIQALSKGGTTGRFEEIISAVTRLKVIATSTGYNLQVHPIFFHGGTGDNVGTTYKAKLLSLYNDLNTDIKAISGQGTLYLFTHQQRLIGTPDYGQQQYEASQEQPNIVVVGPEYPLLSLAGNVQYQGDAVHITNHGTRYLGVIWAQAIYAKLFGSGYKPLELDIANTVSNGSTTLTIPILNKDGTFQTTGNCGIEVYSSTNSAVLPSTSTVSGDNLIITLSSAPVGVQNLLIRTGLTANGTLRSVSSKTSQFNNSLGNPYPLDKYMVRASYVAPTITYPVNVTLNFGGLNADPNVAGTISVWDNVRVYTDVTYTVYGNVTLICKNTASRYWGFVSLGAAKSGDQPVTGSNFYPIGAIDTWWFVESRSADLIITGLNPSKNYKIIAAGCRPAVATLRETAYTINGTTIVKQSNRAGTVSVLTTEAECAVFNSVSPNGSGELLLTVQNQTDVYGYLNVLQVIEL